MAHDACTATAESVAETEPDKSFGDDFIDARIPTLFATSPSTAIGNVFAGALVVGI